MLFLDVSIHQSLPLSVYHNLHCGAKRHFLFEEGMTRHVRKPYNRAYLLPYLSVLSGVFLD